MQVSLIRSFHRCISATWNRMAALATGGTMLLALSLAAGAQQPSAPPQPAPPAESQQTAAPNPSLAPDAAQPPTAQPSATPPESHLTVALSETPAPDTKPAQKPAAGPAATSTAAEVLQAVQEAPGAPASTDNAGLTPEEAQSERNTEEELKQQLVGKPFFLRGGYLDNGLGFDEHGKLVSRSAQGSYTLCAIEVEKLRLTKHKVELEGLRYGLHFLGELPYEDPTTALDRVRITPKKKVVRITIDREIVVKPKKVKEPKKAGESRKSKEGGWLFGKKEAAEQKAPSAELPEKSEAEQLSASIAATPEAERPADAKSVTTTTSPAHAAALLKDALDKIFAPGLDERMMAAMPDFWKLYYKAAAEKTDYRPPDSAVLRQNTVDTKARLLTTFEPPSNEYAQACAVAGMALYHTVIGADGKPGEIAVGRPIGFGLDENAVDSIRKAKFDPAVKDGKPVPVMLDLVVQFRIYSKRTAVVGGPQSAEKAEGPVLPGPYAILPR